jgi:hypothetical protein
VVVTTAGTATIVARVLMPVGAALVPAVPGVSGQLDPVAGSRISGSVFTGYIFPAAVAGSKAALPSNTTPGIGLTIDKNPPAS